MKSILIGFLLLSTLITSAQQQWKFYVAFEDATQSKDTIWFIWDTTATFEGADTSLNEISAQFDYSKFNVWAINPGLSFLDSVKVIAFPFIYPLGGQIEAMNVELPITITWDTSLLHATWLPPNPVGWVNFARIDNIYFFYQNNMDIGHQYDMTISNSVTAPEPWITDSLAWIPEWHFPMNFYLSQDPEVNSEIIETALNFNIYPNPINESSCIKYYDFLNHSMLVNIFDINGQILRSFPMLDNKIGRHISDLSPGIYFASIIFDNGIIKNFKLIKAQ